MSYAAMDAFFYGDPVLAKKIRESLNKKANFHQEIRWELARRGPLTFRDICAIFQGIDVNKISASLCVMNKRGKIQKDGLHGNYTYKIKP